MRRRGALIVIAAALAVLAWLSARPEVAPPGAPARESASAPSSAPESAGPRTPLLPPAAPPATAEEVSEPAPPAGAPPAAGDLPPEGPPPPLIADARADLSPAEAATLPGGGAPLPEVRVETLLREGLGHVTGTARTVGDRAPVVETGVPVELTGKVVEADTGAPVPDAEIVLHSAFYVRTAFYDHHLEEVARAITDREGEYRVDRLDTDPAHFGPGGKVYVTVRAEGHAPQPPREVRVLAPGARCRVDTVALSRDVHTVTGRVVDYWEGKPVAGGLVLATGAVDPVPYPKDERGVFFLWAPRAVTDAEGRFTLEGVGAGVQVLSVHGGDDCAGRTTVLVPVAGEVVIPCRALRGRIAGRVLTDAGDPVPLVYVTGGDNGTHTFADGTFVLENFRGDPVDISFTHPDYEPAVRTGVPDGEKSLEVRLDARLPRVRFRVVDDATGEPTPLVEIRFGFSGGRRPPFDASPIHLGAVGLYELRLPRHATTAEVAAPGKGSATVDLSAARDGDEFEVRLK